MTIAGRNGVAGRSYGDGRHRLKFGHVLVVEYREQPNACQQNPNQTHPHVRIGQFACLLPYLDVIVVSQALSAKSNIL